MKNNNFLQIAVFVLITSLTMENLTAQDYNTGIGFQIFSPSGINIKHFINNQDALEGTLGFLDYGVGNLSFTGLYEIHHSLNPKNLRWFYGGGFNIGSWYQSWDYNGHLYHGSNFGIDGVLGLEYSVREIPLCASLGWNPRFTFDLDSTITTVLFYFNNPLYIKIILIRMCLKRKKYYFCTSLKNR